jgi:CRP-like cAMP-binding protein
MMRWAGGGTRDGKIDQLRRVPMLRACSDAELRRLATAFEVINLPAGTLIQLEGKEIRWFHLILAGDVAMTRNGRILGRSGAGTTVGEVELLCGSPAMGSVVSASEVRAVVMGRRQFTSTLDECPVFRDAIVRSLARGMAAAVAESTENEPVPGPWRPRPVRLPAPPATVRSMAHPSLALRVLPTPSLGA